MNRKQINLFVFVVNVSMYITYLRSIVTKAWLEVKVIGMKKVLFLRLGFSTVASAKVRRAEWDGPSTMSRKSGVFSMLMSTKFSTGLNQPEKPVKVDLNSAVFPGGPPLPPKAPKMTNFVDTKEMVRGPEDRSESNSLSKKQTNK